MFVHNDPAFPLDPYRRQIEQTRDALRDTASFCRPYEAVIVTAKYLYVVRAYGKDTLYDRLSTRPYLTDTEKLWIAFQLLCALEQCERAQVCHGDVKSQNVLVASLGMHVQLTDFATFKPVWLPDVSNCIVHRIVQNNPSTFTFFFDTSRRRSCYVAPERFQSSSAVEADQAQLTHAMDMFSTG